VATRSDDVPQAAGAPGWSGDRDVVPGVDSGDGGLAAALDDGDGGVVVAADDEADDEPAAGEEAGPPAAGLPDFAQPQPRTSTPAASMTLPNTDTFTGTPHVSRQ
jgi:hypothetical protein